MKKNYYSATATAAKITKVPVEVIRAGFRKGAKPTGNVLNAVSFEATMTAVKATFYNGYDTPKGVTRVCSRY